MALPMHPSRINKTEENGMPRECPLLDSGCVAVFKIQLFFFLTSDYAFLFSWFLTAKVRNQKRMECVCSFLLSENGDEKSTFIYMFVVKAKCIKRCKASSNNVWQEASI